MTQRRSDTIAEQIEERIFDGTYPDGSRLDEVRLAEQFGVSRTPLREALHNLANSGLVELIPRRGAFVRQPGPIELVEMFEVMAELEAACGRFATRRMTDQALEDLHQCNQTCQRAVDAGDPDGYYTENERFHQLIYRCCGNRFLEQEAAKLHKRLKPFRRQQLRLRGRMAQSMAEHQAILAALAAGDPDAVSTALRGHVVVQGEKFHRLLASLNEQSAKTAP